MSTFLLHCKMQFRNPRTAPQARSAESKLHHGIWRDAACGEQPKQQLWGGNLNPMFLVPKNSPSFLERFYMTKSKKQRATAASD